MKTQLLTFVIAMLILPLGAVAQEYPHSMKEHHSSKKDQSYPVADAFRQQLRAAYQAGLRLNEAFVASDAAAASKAATTMLEKVQAIDMGLLEGDAHMAWMEYLKPIRTGLEQIAASSDLAAQRKAYAGVSESLYKAVKAFGVGETVYYQYCPMAKASWLSNSEEINNPYYGDKMLRCGSVKEVLQ